MLLRKVIALLVIIQFSFALLTYAQKETVTFVVDSLTQTIKSTLPFNSPVTLLIPIQAKEIEQIFLIEKFKYYDLPRTIKYYIDRSRKNSFTPDTIDRKFYSVKSVNKKDTLVLHFRDEMLLKPSTSYFLIVLQKKLSESAFSFFESYYRHKVSGNSQELQAAKKALAAYEKNMREVFGDIRFNFGWYTVADFENDVNGLFDSTFSASIAPGLFSYIAAEGMLGGFVTNQASIISSSLPDLDSLSSVVLLRDTTINKEALAYLIRQELLLNDITTDIYLSSKQRNLQHIIGGIKKLGCFSCDLSDPQNHNARIANLDQSISHLNNVFKALHLIRGRYRTTHAVENSMRRLEYWVSTLESSKDSLKNLVKLKLGVESKILGEKFPTRRVGNTTYFADFLYSSVVAGNSLLNFETRNKVLLTPDFGVVSSAWNQAGKDIDYGIVPYLGFHLNFMAVDKDVAYNSYKKHWRQYLSLMIGWSLVNLEKDSTYSNFFEKSSLLTGFGYRLSNAVRITVGTQWLFKNYPNSPGKNRTMVALPFAGVSIDLNVNQYINGFVEILSGIGKTNTKTNIETTIPDK